MPDDAGSRWTVAAAAAAAVNTGKVQETRPGLQGADGLGDACARALQDCLRRISEAEAALDGARAAVLGIGGAPLGVERPELPKARSPQPPRRSSTWTPGSAAEQELTPVLQPSVRFLDQALMSCTDLDPDHRRGSRASSKGKAKPKAMQSSWRRAYPVCKPESKKLVMWHGVGIVFIVYLCLRRGDGFSIPYDLCFGPPTSLGMFIIASVVDVYYITDVVLTFMTAYEDETTQKLVTDPGKIARRYLKCWFYVDFVAAIPWDWLDTRYRGVLEGAPLPARGAHSAVRPAAAAGPRGQPAGDLLGGEPVAELRRRRSEGALHAPQHHPLGGLRVVPRGHQQRGPHLGGRASGQKHDPRKGTNSDIHCISP
ncbi:unnamed protein product [Prorocentrum cordatum]|uniref:Ion transport domain-containing protein n=1 Tax=Prorocentrum cordatum TaxID=2364126 RepID=A0ABN9V5Z4_9DINO|nr:unnamed protein product [Polarella glacialis]